MLDDKCFTHEAIEATFCCDPPLGVKSSFHREISPGWPAVTIDAR
ncbi:hypothetical protein [Catellatospora chokoriensis]|nr:hypothetical protein [Catellatospora chokoriensis]